MRLNKLVAAATAAFTLGFGGSVQAATVVALSGQVDARIEVQHRYGSASYGPTDTFSGSAYETLAANISDQRPHTSGDDWDMNANITATWLDASQGAVTWDPMQFDLTLAGAGTGSADVYGRWIYRFAIDAADHLNLDYASSVFGDVAADPGLQINVIRVSGGVVELANLTVTGSGQQVVDLDQAGEYVVLARSRGDQFPNRIGPGHWEGGQQASLDWRIGAVGGVPEPATWALMIVGFGGAGAMLRRRRRWAASA